MNLERAGRGASQPFRCRGLQSLARYSGRFASRVGRQEAEYPGYAADLKRPADAEGQARTEASQAWVKG